MKKIILLIVSVFFFGQILTAQTDSTFINQINDSTFIKVNITFDEEGRETSIQKVYYDSLGFSDLLFDLTVNADNSFQSAEKQVIDLERNVLVQRQGFNFLKQDYQTFTGKNYAIELTERLKSEMQGSWRLRVGNDIFNLETAPSGIVLLDNDSSKRARIIFLQVGKLTLRQVGTTDFFFSEEVEFTKNENGIWIGETLIDDVETRVFLRKVNQ